MTIKRMATLILALYTNAIYTDEYIFFESTEALYKEVGKRSANIDSFIKKHQLLQLQQQENGSPRVIAAINELIRISEHELENYPILKKQFISDLWLDLAMERFDAADYAKSEYYCDLAMAVDPENPFSYEAKAHFRRQAGNESQALAYEKIAKEKGIDRH